MRKKSLLVACFLLIGITACGKSTEATEEQIVISEITQENDNNSDVMSNSLTQYDTVVKGKNNSH